jgi:vacuolar-type H+-ATPase subunit H
VSDIIERLLEVEHQARLIIAQAEHDADKAGEEARNRARQILQEGREDAHRRAQQILDANERELEQRRQERLGEERSRLRSPADVPPEALAEAVEVVVAAIAPVAQSVP